jgi:hypothetical protein
MDCGLWTVGSGLWTVDSGSQWGFGRLNQLIIFFPKFTLINLKKSKSQMFESQYILRLR